MRIIVIRPPVRVNQANNLAVRLASPHVSTGRLFRESISMGTKLGNAGKHYFEAGDQVPSGITNALVAERTTPARSSNTGCICTETKPRLCRAQTWTDP
jgi:adenylate kinase